MWRPAVDALAGRTGMSPRNSRQNTPLLGGATAASLATEELARPAGFEPVAFGSGAFALAFKAGVLRSDMATDGADGPAGPRTRRTPRRV